jgi:2-polyprenyl-3-methyl-5-hydroxy-6-metoxy-1,4-benzoquinol methylase
MMSHAHENPLEPSSFLVENVDILPKGRVFDVAMGSGRNAVYLAKKGFVVEGVDISAEAIKDTLESAKQEGVKIRAQAADLEGNYRIKQGAYEVIICFNYLQRSLIPQIKDGIRKGGMVVYETYTVDHAQFRKPRNPAHLLKHNELLDMFRDFRCHRYWEGIIQAEQKAVASIIAEKV